MDNISLEQVRVPKTNVTFVTIMALTNQILLNCHVAIIQNKFV